MIKRHFSIQRTAGPLGRAFGFEATLGPLSFAINAGWYIFAVRFRRVGFVQLASKPLQLDCYSSRFSK